MAYSELKKELILDANVTVKVCIFDPNESFKETFLKAGKYNIEHLDKISATSDYNVIIVTLEDYINNLDYLNKLSLDGKYILGMFRNKQQIECSSENVFNNCFYKIISDDIEESNLATIICAIENLLVAEKSQELLLDKYKTVLTNFKTMIDIGASLSEIRDIDKLFGQILSKSREITKADAGSIYLIIENKTKDEDGNEKTEKLIKFEKSQNFSFDLKTPTFTMPITKKSVVGYAALTGVTENIPDAHNIPPEKDYSYSVESEKALKVRNKSVIVTPMLNNHGEIIGVLQLFNKKRDFNAKINEPEAFEEQVIPFTSIDEEIVTSFASQAGVTLENSLLYKEINAIFEGFIRASVTAIESRDPTTSGHSSRVSLLTAEFARVLNTINTGKYKDVHFTEDHIKHIEYAGLLHDFGKIGVRESVLVKSEKLYPEQLQAIKDRFSIIKNLMINDTNATKLEIIDHDGYDAYLAQKASLDAELQVKLAELQNNLDTVFKANKPTMLEDDSSAVISNLLNKEYISKTGEKVTYIYQFEVDALLVKRGSLTNEERKEIESHVTHSYEFLKQIPWTSDMTCIPEIAYQHHEKLNGKGYPRGLTEEQINVEAKMMAIVDIYDALTATDRPYKKAAPIDKALQILDFNEKDGSIDGELLRIFKENKIYEVLNKK